MTEELREELLRRREVHSFLLASEKTRKNKEKPRKLEIFGVNLARLAGFEPATYRFVAGHSIH